MTIHPEPRRGLIRHLRALVLALLVTGLPSSNPRADSVRTPPSVAQRISFPAGFKWCVATAAHQIEGGNRNSDWWEWEHRDSPCRIARCEKSSRATDHWNRTGEDLALLQDLGVGTYRMSVEWAKLEPEPGRFDPEVVAHYRREIDGLRRAGIAPLITLQHFTLPLWVARRGGWTWEGMPAAFEAYTRFVYKNIAPAVRDFVTINEPLVHLGGGYVLGLTPPGLGPGNRPQGVRSVSAPSLLPKAYAGESGDEPGACGDLGHGYIGDAAPGPEDLRRLVAPARGLLLSHARAYAALHELARFAGTEVRVGMAHHLRVFDPRSWLNPLDIAIAEALDRLWNWSIPNALRTGELRFSLPLLLTHAETIPGLAGTQDFFGINYYTRDIAWFRWDKGPSVGLGVPENAPRNDLAWEIYPKGIFRLLHSAHRRFPDLPIFITENGVADCTDRKRAPFIDSHLAWIHRAISRGVPVEGYCHWSLIDNFEWTEGFLPKLGLYEVDYTTFERKARPSVSHFREIIRSNSLPARSAE